MAEQLPVTIAVHKADGSTESVRVGTATREGDSLVIRLNDLVVGAAGAGAGAGSSRPTPAPRPAASSGALPTVFPNYGRGRGLPIAGASVKDLEFYASGARQTLNDPGKTKWHEKERMLLQAIDTELAKQRPGGAAGSGSSDEPPPPSDDDAPSDED